MGLTQADMGRRAVHVHSRQERWTFQQKAKGRQSHKATNNGF